MSFLFNDVKIPNICRERLIYLLDFFSTKVSCVSLFKICVDAMFTLVYLRNVKGDCVTFDNTTCNHYLKILNFRSKGKSNCTHINYPSLFCFFDGGLPAKMVYSLFLEAFAAI